MESSTGLDPPVSEALPALVAFDSCDHVLLVAAPLMASGPCELDESDVALPAAPLGASRQLLRHADMGESDVKRYVRDLSSTETVLLQGVEVRC